MDRATIAELIKNQRAFLATGQTRDLPFRIEQLKKLKRAIMQNEQAIFEALRQDLNKPPFEAYGGDVGIVLNEIDHALKHIRRWAKPRRVRTPLAYFPGKSSIIPEPYGLALIIGPWNFPFQLMLAPLAGALSAGNCAVLKPSELAPASSRLIAKIINDHFDPAYLAVVEGGAETAKLLLEERYDYIFFTGGTAVGRIVMQAAARHLTPVTLELGGKNPCIVDADTHLDYTARRIVWGKFFNAGQSCVAVDYLLVDRRVKEPLLKLITKRIKEFYGDDPSQSPDYARIVNETHFDRLSRLCQGTIIAGGGSDRPTRYIAPTIIDRIAGDEPIMQEEIFGPLLPVIAYDDLAQAIGMINKQPKPLALYVFSRNREVRKRVLRETSSGGACINDTVIHETSARLPFGGVGESGIGKYHGKAGFDAFSHERSVIKSGFFFDIKLRYPPYRDRLKLLKRIF